MLTMVKDGIAMLVAPNEWHHKELLLEGIN